MAVHRWTGNNFDAALAGLWVYSGVILHRASPCAFDGAPSELHGYQRCSKDYK